MHQGKLRRNDWRNVLCTLSPSLVPGPARARGVQTVFGGAVLVGDRFNRLHFVQRRPVPRPSRAGIVFRVRVRDVSKPSGVDCLQTVSLGAVLVGDRVNRLHFMQRRPVPRPSWAGIVLRVRVRDVPKPSGVDGL